MAADGRQQASTRPRGGSTYACKKRKVSNEAAWITLRRRRFISGASRLSSFIFATCPRHPGWASVRHNYFTFAGWHIQLARHFDRDQVIMTPEDVTFFSLTVSRSFLWVMRGA